MKRIFSLMIPILLVLYAVSRLPAEGQEGKNIERGKYLINNVALCSDCHTPRDEKGQFIESQWLQGSTLDFQPMHTMPGWADVAPAIAGLPTLSDEEAVVLLETGKYARGQVPGPPMPHYRFSHEDAVAAVAYLKSLKSN